MDKYLKNALSDVDLKICKTTSDLEICKQTKNRVNLSKLPDKGTKLLSRIDELENLLKDLTLSKEISDKNINSTVKLEQKNNIQNHDSMNELENINKNATDLKKQLSGKRESGPSIISKDRISGTKGESITKSSSVKCKSKIVDGTSSGLLDFAKKDENETAKDKGMTNDKNGISVAENDLTSMKSKVKDNFDSSRNKIPVKSLESPENSNDSGFISESSNLSDKADCFQSSIHKILPSFEKLSQKVENNFKLEQTIPDSPAFKSYRDPQGKTLIKMIDAKPLFEKGNKKCYSKGLVTSCASPLSNQEIMEKLHTCLNIYPDNSEEENEPKYLKTKLLRHQIKALSWAVWRESQIPSGGILADDMGLGKTLTMISLILKQRKKTNIESYNESSYCKGTLIICVASVLHQWQDEITKHCKPLALNVLIYHGPKRDRNVEFMSRHDVVLTTYSTLQSENKISTESGLYRLKWERVILDEAHTIKNYNSLTAKAVFSLNSFKHWCMTGTPIHNDIKDMFSLIKFLKFSPFDDLKNFKKLMDNDSKSCDDRRNLLVRSILLRRTKNDVDDSGKPLVAIKNKSVLIDYIELSPEEKDIYLNLDEKAKDILQKMFKTPTSKFKNSSSLLVLLLRLQQCCNHVSLLGQETEENVNDSLSDITSGLSSMCIKDDSKRESISDSFNITFTEYEKRDIYDKSVKSTKIEKLFEELDKIAKESNNTAKSVIVSQWVSMLKLVEYHLVKDGKTYHMIIGDTKLEDRQWMSKDMNFNSDGCKIMLLSLKAGGTGLNLVGASHLFLLDLHWNPALEQQACDRIHRVGQKHNVFIHKFVCKDTIEERILAFQEKKTELASDVLVNAGQVKKGLSMEDFRSLFNISL